MKPSFLIILCYAFLPSINIALWAQEENSQAFTQTLSVDNYREKLDERYQYWLSLNDDSIQKVAQDDLKAILQSYQKYAESYANLQLGNLYRHQMQTKDSALYSFLESLHLAHIYDQNWEIIQASLALAKFFNAHRKPETAIGYAQMAVHKAQEEGLKYEFVNAYFQLGTAYYQVNSFLEAKKAFQIIQEDSDLLGKTRHIINFWNMLGLMADQEQEYAQANAYYQKALKIAEESQSSPWIGIIKGNQALIYIDQQQYEKAEPLLKTDIQLSREYGEYSNMIQSSIQLARMYRIQEKVKLAKGLLLSSQQALDSLQTRKKVFFLKEIYAELLEIAINEVNQLQIEQYWDSLNHYQDSVETIQAQEQSNGLTYLLGQEELENTLGELIRSRGEAIQEVKSRDVQRNWMFFFLLILGLSLILLIVQNRKHIKTLRVLRAKNIEINSQKDKIDEQENAISQVNETLVTQNEELKQIQEETMAQSNLLEDKNDELHKLNLKLGRQEAVLRKAVKKLREGREVIRTQKENLEAEVAERTQELYDKNRELINYTHQLEQFAYVTAHNLRAPIARLLGLVSILDLEQVGSQENRLYLEKFEAVCLELDEIIRDLNAILELKKKNKGIQETISLETPLNKVLTILEDEISSKKAKIQHNLDEIPEINSVRLYWESILYNLISNAIKYCQEDQAPEINIHAVKNEAHLQVKISDNGLGIDLERYGDKLFGLYKRFHNHIDGKGLGLHLVKLQVESLGGKIRIESEVQKGTDFILDFDLNHPENKS